ncbi:MAG TPA: hypothetical protein VFT46_01185 [Holophagaceae bacterium]|nr:hypothetical protein [Holophagaceae bacterium]
MRRLALLGAASLGPVLMAATPAPLPFARVAPTASYVVFYRGEAGWQFVFACAMPGRRLVAVEIDRLARSPDGDEGEDAEEAGEVVHHLPIARFQGEIQYLPLSRLPLSRARLLEARKPRVDLLGADLRSTSRDRDHWLALEGSLAP